MALEKTDCIIAGAGVIGLAIARTLSQAGREVIVIDRADKIGAETSSRNSEVIHAGIYYPPGSLKAQLCVRGRALLYDFCENHAVPHARTGKLIVATHVDQEEELNALRQRAQLNGVDDLRLISGREAIADQPALSCTAALLSPSTGILDSHAFMLALQGDAEEAGSFICLKTEITEVEATGSGFVVQTSGEEAFELECQNFINSSGLDAPDLARKIKGLSQETVPQAYLAKGNYFRLAARAPFSRLIYPVPEPGGLGVHITFDMGGQARFGPDVEWVDTLDYAVDTRRSEDFYAAVRRYWPALPDGSLVPDYSGIRPKITGPEDPAADFRISDETEHGLPGLVNLYGIESPGLTSALAIAEVVNARL